MRLVKTKIVLDADVIIHFIKGGMLNVLPIIFLDYDYVILNFVYDELSSKQKEQINNQIHFFQNIQLINYTPTGLEVVEYARLRANPILGKGESACMVFCKYNNDVVGSSNLKDIQKYCLDNKITFLTTMDFLAHALRKNLLTVEQCNKFIYEVKNSDSKLPVNFIEEYSCKVEL
ncbi:MAG: hypothetical protein A2X18_05385 [Bacteroidetes bacterium GWF2_40_14]|nr:MAG: hypothetical protein A2X18_05385 [Bacteroidetes bacterium GWF2_40_14]